MLQCLANDPPAKKTWLGYNYFEGGKLRDILSAGVPPELATNSAKPLMLLVR
jgi:hypothetical protein